MARTASRYRVVMFDSLGIGETGGHTPATVEATADFAGRVIEQMLVRVDEALVRRTKCDSYQTQGAVTLS